MADLATLVNVALYWSQSRYNSPEMDSQQAGQLANKMMRKQLRLSLSIATIFIVILVGLPLLNLYAPDVAGSKFGGFTATWLVLGVLFYPLTWFLSSWFVNGSERIEEEIVAEESK
jgi:uncharacterized membrane protein (DUF485 family)